MVSKKVHESFEKVRRDESKSLNIYAIRHSSMELWINNDDRAFYSDIARKQKLTDRQLTRKRIINWRLVKRYFEEDEG